MMTLGMLSTEIEHLDPLPVSQPLLATAVADASVGIAEIVKIIQYDPALTANTLKLSNSSYYSPASPIESVHDAVVFLGAGRILQYMVGSGLRHSLAEPCPGYELEENELWKHSVAAAVAAELLPQFAGVPIHPVAFTAALLHDIGKLVISRHLEESDREEIRHAERMKKLSYVEAERMVLGFDHAQVGGVMARRWRFPEAISDAIAHHHGPRHEERDNRAVDAVHVANAVAKIIGVGVGSEEMNMIAYSESARALGLKTATLEALCAATAEELPEVLELFEEA